uniref:Uncharacterized protein n=1 Tax=Tetranychus urticae TaxID=32264 RepID=T1KPG6_TETUR
MQPLDVCTFPQWKDFVKRFQERVILDRAPVNLQSREAIITMNSLILNQFKSPLFCPMFRYAWSKAGFPIESIRFEGLKEICFEPDAIICTDCSDNRGSFIQCALTN